MIYYINDILYNNNDILYRCLYHNVYFINIFKYISELLTILITLDSIIQNNDNLLNSWNSYKSMITIIRQNPSDFNTNIDNIIIFEIIILFSKLINIFLASKNNIMILF